MLNVLVVSQTSGGLRSRMCLKQICGKFFRVHNAFVARMMFIVFSFSAKNFGIGRLIHAAEAQSFASFTVDVRRILRSFGGTPHLMFDRLNTK